MTPEQKKLIVDDLRSGKHKQGECRLHRRRTDGQDEFCCLGRMCVVFGAEVAHEVENGDGSYEVYYKFGHSSFADSTALPDSLAYLLGITPEGTMKTPVTHLKYLNQRATCLAQANDAGYTFEQIADIIEEQF